MSIPLVQVGNAVSVPHARFCDHLRRFAQGAEVAPAKGERRRAAEQIQDLKTETPAQRFRILIGDPVGRPRLEHLPKPITWRRKQPVGPARFEVWYDDGANLAEQIAQFMRAASANKEDFYEATEAAARPSLLLPQTDPSEVERIPSFDGPLNFFQERLRTEQVAIRELRLALIKDYST